MTDLLSEPEALKETLAVMAKYAPAPGVLCAPTMEMGLGWKAKSLLAKIDTHHAEIAVAVRDAAYGRALRTAMEAEYQAAKESRKGGKQEAWITTYSLLRRIKVAADHLADMGNPITEQDQPLAAMRAGEGWG